MGSLFRSETMCLIQLFIQSESAHDTVSDLGEVRPRRTAESRPAARFRV